MARKRMLSPEFFSSAPVNRLPYTAMITFAGLWCYFDDYGRGEDDPALIKAAIWPRRRAMTEAKVAHDVDVIEAEGLICRYSHTAGHLSSRELSTVKEWQSYHPVIATRRVIHIPSWAEHQKISHPTPSKLPPCPEHELRENSAYQQRHGGISGNAPELLASRSGRPPP
jgi:hypothetical protein